MLTNSEQPTLFQRFIHWREAQISEKQFVLFLSFLVGIFTATAALVLNTNAIDQSV